MVDGVTLDLSCASPLSFVMPDASGLVPLSLPEAFLEKQRIVSPQLCSEIQSAQPSPGTISRFEAAMGESLPHVAVNLASINTLIERGMSPAIKDVKAGTDPLLKVGTDPIPQKTVVVEKRVETPDLPNLRENIVVAEPVANVKTAPVTTVTVAPAVATPAPKGTDPIPETAIKVVPDPIAPKLGTDPSPVVVDAVKVDVKVGTDPLLKLGTDPIPQKAVVAEKGIETPSLPNLRENVVVAEPVATVKTAPAPAAVTPAPKGTDPVLPKGTDPDKEIKVVESRSVVDLNEAVEIDEKFEKPQAQVLQAVPVSVAAAAVVDVQSDLSAQQVSAVSAASARTEAVVDTVNNLVEAVVSQISVTPSLVRGEGEVRMILKANVLDGSEITLSSKDGTLAVVVTPTTPEAAQTVAAAMPRLEVALAEHAPAFRQVAVKLVARKGNVDESA